MKRNMRNRELRAINLRERNKGGDEKLTGLAGMGAIGTTKTGTEGTVETSTSGTTDIGTEGTAETSVVGIAETGAMGVVGVADEGIPTFAATPGPLKVSAKAGK